MNHDKGDLVLPVIKTFSLSYPQSQGETGTVRWAHKRFVQAGGGGGARL